MNINEKFFRVEKLKFLAPLTRLLGQRELRTRCCPERPKMTFKHFIGVYYMNISHVGPLWGLFRYPRGAQKGPFGLKKTLTGRKASEHPRGARFGPNCCQLVWLSWNHGYHTLWPCIGPLLGPQGHQKGPFWPEMPLFGVTEVLGGPPGNRFGPHCRRLAWLGWNHGCHTLWPCIRPLLGLQGHQKVPFWP